MRILTALLLSLMLPLSLAPAAWATGEAVMGDDGLHKTDWMCLVPACDGLGLR